MGFLQVLQSLGRLFKKKEPKRAALSEEDIRVMCAEWDAELKVSQRQDTKWFDAQDRLDYEKKWEGFNEHSDHDRWHVR